MKDIYKELQDLRYLNWSKTRKSSGTAGSFLKSYDDTGKKKKYYKLSDYDPANGIIGHECVNEIVVQRLLRLLKIEHLDYRLIHASVIVDDNEFETYLCESDDYKNEFDNKIAFEDFYLMEREQGESPLEFCIRNGWEKNAYEMILADYLVLNRDRHGANIEVLRNLKDKTVRLAPLFDHGLSLLCRCHTPEEIKDYDVCEDKKVQSFIGTSSVYENLRLIPSDFLKNYPVPDDTELAQLFEGLEGIISKTHIEKLHEMIKKRWCGLGNI